MNTLSLKEKIGFGLGDAASNIVFQMVINYMLIFYTDVFGITAAAAGTLMLVVRIFDAVTDPVMGGIADRTQTRWGRYRPYLIWMAPPYALFAVLAFTTPDFSESGKLIYAYITYALLMTFYTAINIPYSALGGVITADPQERASAQSWRFVLAMLGGAAVTAVVPVMVNYFGGESASFGYSMAMLMMSVAALLCFFACFSLTKERVDMSGREQNKNMLQDLFLVFKNDQWVIIALVTFVLLTGLAMKGGSMPYYVQYYLNSEAMVGTFVSASMVAGLFGSLFAGWMVKRLCKVKLMNYAAIALSATYLVLYFIPREALYIAFVLALLANFFHMIFIPILFSTVADTVDYGFIKKGHGALGMSSSGHLFALKIGIALGGAFTGWLLSYFSYQPNQVQTQESLDGIKFIFAFCSFVSGIIVIALLRFYKLNKAWLEANARTDN